MTNKKYFWKCISIATAGFFIGYIVTISVHIYQNNKIDTILSIISLIATFLGIIVTLAIGYQIYNSIELKNNFEQFKKELQKKVDVELKEITDIAQKEKESNDIYKKSIAKFLLQNNIITLFNSLQNKNKMTSNDFINLFFDNYINIFLNRTTLDKYKNIPDIIINNNIHYKVYSLKDYMEIFCITIKKFYETQPILLSDMLIKFLNSNINKTENIYLKILNYQITELISLMSDKDNADKIQIHIMSMIEFAKNPNEKITIN